jgi:hypothetical protein
MKVGPAIYALQTVGELKAVTEATFAAVEQTRK